MCALSCPRSALYDDELRSQCKYWKIPMQEPPTKPKEKPEQMAARQETLREEIKVAEKTYYQGLKSVYADMTDWFYDKQSPTES